MDFQALDSTAIHLPREINASEVPDWPGPGMENERRQHWPCQATSLEGPDEMNTAAGAHRNTLENSAQHGTEAGLHLRRFDSWFGDVR